MCTHVFREAFADSSYVGLGKGIYVYVEASADPPDVGRRAYVCVYVEASVDVHQIGEGTCKHPRIPTEVRGRKDTLGRMGKP